MRCRKSLVLIPILVASISASYAIEKDKKFAAPPISSVETKVTNDGVTVAAIPYVGAESIKTAFGKVNPYQNGILPVLVLVENNTNKAIKLDAARFEYIDRDRSRIESTPAAEVKYSRSPQKPNYNPSPIPGLGRSKKNPLEAEEIQVRAFAAKMLPPGESAHGFVYFQTGHRSGSKLYVTGLQEAGTGKDLFYFEVPLD